MNKVVRVLQISGTMNIGGQEAFIMNLYRNIDREKIQFDFIVHTLEENYYEPEIKKLGGRVYHITPITKNVFKHCIDLYKIIRNNKYTVVHRHTAFSISWIDLFIAKIAGVKTRIAHSHSSNINENKTIHFIFRPLLNKFSNKKFACSELAGQFLFGKKKFEIIYNGIDVKKFKYDMKKRARIREEINLKNELLIGHVGRFTYAKNHDFILEVFEKYLLNYNKNAHLLLVGSGERENEIKEIIISKKLEKNVSVLSNRSDVNDILSAIDVFIFPSFYEGLPVTLVEAQANGLPIIASDRITNLTTINASLVNSLSIEDSSKWAQLIDILSEHLEKNRIEKNKKIVNSKFDISNVTKVLFEIYIGGR